MDWTARAADRLPSGGDADPCPPRGGRRRSTAEDHLPRGRPPIPRAPPPAGAAAGAAARRTERAPGARASRVASVRPARDRRSQSRPGAPGAHRRLSPGDDGCSPLRAAAPVRGLQQGPQPPAHGGAAALPPHLGSIPRPARCRHVRRARAARRGAARPDPPGRSSLLDRRRAARVDRLVLAADEPGARDPGGAGRGRHPGDRRARRQPPHLRPGRTAVPGRSPRRAPHRPRAGQASAPLPVPGKRTARRRWPGGALDRDGPGGARPCPSGSPHPDRAAHGADRRGRARPRARRRGARPPPGRRLRRARAGPRRDRGRRRFASRRRSQRGELPRPARPAVLGSRPAARAVRVRLRVGGLRPAGQAPLGLLRAADPVRRPSRRPDRAALRSACPGRPRARDMVGTRLRPAGGGRVRARLRVRAAGLPCLRRRVPRHVPPGPVGPRAGGRGRAGRQTIGQAERPTADDQGPTLPALSRPRTRTWTR